jgi:outer membrane protein OmpA-like peptidoglycan-associated protein
MFRKQIFWAALSVVSASSWAADMRQAYIEAAEATVTVPAHEAHVVSEVHRDFRLAGEGKPFWLVSERPRPAVLLPEEQRALDDAERERQEAVAAVQRPKAMYFFAFNKVAPHPGVDLKPVVDYAKSGGLSLLVVGHADEAGTDEYNQQLSERRAVAVAKKAVALGFPPDMVVVEGRGKREPADVTNRAANRRAEVIVLPAVSRKGEGVR